MHTFVEVRSSDIPSFAYNLYHHPLSSPDMKSDILTIVQAIGKAIEEDHNVIDILSKSTFVFYQGRWIRDEYFTSFEDIENRFGCLKELQILSLGKSDSAEMYESITSTIIRNTKNSIDGAIY